MKYYVNCKDTEDEFCPICGTKLSETPQEAGDVMKENEAAEIISTMMVTGIL